MKKLSRILPILFIFSLLLSSCQDKKKASFEKVREGVRMVYRNDNAGAKKLFNEAIELDPENAEAWYQRANTYADEGNFDQALSDYNEAIWLKPTYADAYFNRGLVKKYMGNEEGACADFRKAHDLGKENIVDYFKHCP